MDDSTQHAYKVGLGCQQPFHRRVYTQKALQWKQIPLISSNTFEKDELTY